jgi:hypothetical protein
MQEPINFHSQEKNYKYHWLALRVDHQANAADNPVGK